MSKGRIFFILLVLGLSLSVVANAELIIKVSSTDTGEKVYGNDIIAIGVDGESSSEAEAQEADRMTNFYIRSIQGYRYLRLWTKDIFKSPSEVVVTEQIFSETTTNLNEYLLVDTFPRYKIEYRVRVYNEGKRLILGMPFYKGGILVTPKKISFFQGGTLAPANPPTLGKLPTTWGSLKSG